MNDLETRLLARIIANRIMSGNVGLRMAQKIWDLMVTDTGCQEVLSALSYILLQNYPGWIPIRKEDIHNGTSF
jgi:hypothetical protein